MLLRQIEVLISQGKSAGALPGSRNFAAELLSLAKGYGGLELDQAKRMKDLERENVCLKRLVADLSLVADAGYQPPVTGPH